LEELATALVLRLNDDIELQLRLVVD